MYNVVLTLSRSSYPTTSHQHCCQYPGVVSIVVHMVSFLILNPRAREIQNSVVTDCFVVSCVRVSICFIYSRVIRTEVSVQ